MDVQGLNDQQVQKILTMMDVCALEFEDAKRLLQRSDFNVEAATLLHFNPQPQIIEKPHTKQPYQQAYHKQDYYGGDYYDQNSDPLYTRFRNFRMSGQKFQSKYPLSQDGMIKGLLNKLASKFKGETSAGEKFVQKLNQVYPALNKVNFINGQFLDAVYQVRKQKFPLIVFLNDFKDINKNLCRTLISNSNLVEFFNTSFRIIGFDTTNYEMDKNLAQIVDKRNFPCLAVIKVDQCEEIVPMDILELTADIDIKEMKQRLNKSKSQYIKDQIREDQYLKKYKNQMIGIYDDDKLTFEQRLQLEQQRKLKRQQEADLKKSDKQIEIKKKEQEVIKEKQKQKLQEAQKIVQVRQQKRKNFKLYEEGVKFRIRLPNGQQFKLSVPINEKIQYLFDYVQTLQECGFQQNVYRKYDIIRPYDKLTLKQSKQKSLLQVFGETDSENLAVNQL